MSNEEPRNTKKEISDKTKEEFLKEFPEFEKKQPVKNQHYVPQFYLKHFSMHPDKKTIQAYWYKQKRCIENSVESTCREKYTYGENSIVEWSLATLEHDASIIINKILSDPENYVFYRPEYDVLLEFIMTLHARSIRLRDEYRQFLKDFGEKLPEHLGITDYTIKFPEEDFPYIFPLQFFGNVIVNYLQLQPLVLINNTESEFFTSDCPVCIYNTAFIKENLSYGAMSSGIQLYLPLSNRVALLLFDPQYYTLSNNNSMNYFPSKYQIEELNKIVIFNSRECVIFGNSNNKKVIGEFSEKLKKKSPEITNIVSSNIETNSIIFSPQFYIKGMAHLTFLKQKKRITNRYDTFHKNEYDFNTNGLTQEK